MSQVELSGDLSIEVDSKKIPVKCYDNVIELQVNTFGILFKVLSIFFLIKKHVSHYSKIRQSIKVVLVSKHPLIKLIGIFSRFI